MLNRYEKARECHQDGLVLAMEEGDKELEVLTASSMIICYGHGKLKFTSVIAPTLTPTSTPTY